MGGIYIPPHKRDTLVGDSDEEIQKSSWEVLKRRVKGVVNKANAGNLDEVALEAFRLNVVRGRGLFCRAVLAAQGNSHEFTAVYAALVAILNTKLPEIGELLLARLLAQFRRGYRRSDKGSVLSTTKFLAHLVNQQVAHEVVALELVTVLLERPTDDSVEVAVAFIRECGAYLSEVAPKGVQAIFERLRSILHEGEGIQKRVQYVIEGLFALRRKNFEGHPPIQDQLDLVEEEDRITHEISLDDQLDIRKDLDVFHFDDNFHENEEDYDKLKQEILGDDQSAGAYGEDNDDDDDDEGQVDGVGRPNENGENDGVKPHHASDGGVGGHPGGPIDHSQADLIGLRRTIYLTIMSSLSFEEGSHKLAKLMAENPNRERELCEMIVSCCSQERSYLKYYGLLGQRFCLLHRVYVQHFEDQFAHRYAEIHRYDTTKIRNIARFFAELFRTDALPWQVFNVILISEEETTSSSRIFLKVLFQDLAQYLSVENLRQRLLESPNASWFDGLFPRDSLQHTRFAINFFTSIGLGALTDEMREHLRSAPRPSTNELAENDSADDSSSLSSSLSSSSSPTPSRDRLEEGASTWGSEDNSVPQKKARTG